MGNLIKIENLDGQLVVTSRQVAEDFEKEHNKVIRTIEGLFEGIAKNGDTPSKYFIMDSYKNSQNNQKYIEYLLTRDGFSLLVMGFTGAKALQWKLKYIEAFNIMENTLKNGSTKQLSAMELLELQFKATKEVKEEVDILKEDLEEFKGNTPLFNIECKELQALVRKIGVGVLGGKGSQAYKDNSLRCRVYSDIQQQIRREFGVSRYEAIKRCELEVARDIIENYKAPIILKNQIDEFNSQINFSASV